MSKTIISEQRILPNNKSILQTTKEISDNGFEYIDKKIILPKITDEELLKRYTRIKPIVLYKEMYYYLKKYNIYQIRNYDYLWDLRKNIRKKVDMNNSEVIGEFPCFHTFGYVGMFKPSIAEVLSQFPDELIKEANAFYLSEYPQNINDLNMQSEIISAGCHKSTVKALILKK